jgi:hypothetical protein
VSFILADEAAFFTNQFEVRSIIDRYVLKSDSMVALTSTPSHEGDLMDEIRKEPEESCMFKRLYVDYTVALDKLFTLDEINNAKRTSPAFEREFNLSFTHAIGNVFSTASIERAIELGRLPGADQLHIGGRRAMGIDVGFSTSKTSVVILQTTNNRLQVLHSSEHERPKKVDDIAGETIALVGKSFRGISFLRLSEIKSNDKITVVHERISADLRDCVRQISEVEALKQNKKNNNSSNSNLIANKEHEVEVMQEARSMLEALDPQNNKSIDAKEFLAGKVIYLPEPYLILRDSPVATYQNIMGITFNNLAAVVNILAREHNYKIISTAYDNHTMYVFMEKMGTLR